VVKFKAGQNIIQKGQAGDIFYIIKEVCDANDAIDAIV
jgi:hypothetical protein